MKTSKALTALGAKTETPIENERALVLETRRFLATVTKPAEDNPHADDLAHRIRDHRAYKLFQTPDVPFYNNLLAARDILTDLHPHMSLPQQEQADDLLTRFAPSMDQYRKQVQEFNARMAAKPTGYRTALMST